MPKIERYDEFEDIFDFFKGCKIHHYAEFDNSNHCYYYLKNCIPFVNHKSDGEAVINIRDADNGEVLHVLSKERDFDLAEVEFKGSMEQITLHYRSKYKYIFLLERYK